MIKAFPPGRRPPPFGVGGSGQLIRVVTSERHGELYSARNEEQLDVFCSSCRPRAGAAGGSDAVSAYPTTLIVTALPLAMQVGAIRVEASTATSKRIRDRVAKMSLGPAGE